MYQTVTRDSKVYNVKKISFKDFKNTIGDLQSAGRL